MRKLLALFTLFACSAAFAQYGPPTQAAPQASQATPAFWAQGKTAYLAASTSSASIALSVTGTGAIQVYNSTTGVAFVALCLTSTCTASAGTSGTSTSDYPVAPGSVVVISIPAGTTYVAAILSTSSGAVYLTPGAGT